METNRDWQSAQLGKKREYDGTMKVEKEYCVRCDRIRHHVVVYKTKKNGDPWRDGICNSCFMHRQLPLLDIDPGEFKMPFGQYIGTPLKDLKPSYISWVLQNVELKYPMRKRLEYVLHMSIIMLERRAVLPSYGVWYSEMVEVEK